DVGHQPLKADALAGIGRGLAQILVDDGDLLGVPAERQRLLAEAVLALGTLAVLFQLKDGGLADVEIGFALEVVRQDLAGIAHGVTSKQRRTTDARTVTRSRRPGAVSAGTD